MALRLRSASVGCRYRIRRGIRRTVKSTIRHVPKPLIAILSGYLSKRGRIISMVTKLAENAAYLALCMTIYRLLD